MLDMQEVTGSSPVSPTIFTDVMHNNMYDNKHDESLDRKDMTIGSVPIVDFIFTF